MIQQSEQTHVNCGESIHVGAIAVWLAIQFGALTLSALRVPLWARPPQPIESVAAEQMLVVQMVCASMLFGWLMHNRVTSFFTILSSAPMLLFAGALAEMPFGNTSRGWVYLCVWLTALSCWSAVLPERRARLLGVTVALVFVLGGPTLHYLSAEFHHSAPFGSRAWFSFDVIGVSVLQIHSDQVDVANWIIPSLALLGGVGVLVMKYRAVVTTSYPQGRGDSHRL